MERKQVHLRGECTDRAYGKNCDGWAEWVEDPYAADIWGDSVYDWYCDGEYTGRMMDI